jgi:hypothetical protein
MARLLAHKPLPLPIWMFKGLWLEAEPHTAVFESILKSLVDSIMNMQVRQLHQSHATVHNGTLPRRFKTS